MSLGCMSLPAFAADGDDVGEENTTTVANVAQIGDVKYTSLQAAFDEAKDGDIITLLADLTQDDGVKFDNAGATVKLNLDSKTFTVNTGSNVNNRAIRIDKGTLEVYGGSIVAVGSGTNSSNGTGCYGAFRVEANGKLIARNLTLENSRPWGLNVKVLGGEAELTNVMINSSYGGGIEVTEADLGEHSKTGKATLTNCTFTQENFFDHCSTALSVSGGSELNVESGSYTGERALYVFSSGGVINVEGGTFTGLENNGRDAIVAEIDTKTYPKYTGGLTISGGNFTGTYGITSPAYLSITGGTFSSDPSAYVADGYKAVKDGDVWTVVAKTYVAEANGQKFETLEEALAEISTVTESTHDKSSPANQVYKTYTANGTITLLANCDGDGFIIGSGSNLRIDFAGHTYSVTGRPVGSNGTETIGFQLLQNSNITFKNGTLYGDSTYGLDDGRYLVRMIQNYSNLTLDNMTVDYVGAFYDQMTMSNCNGAINIIDSTINAPDFSRLEFSPAEAAESLGAEAMEIGTFSTYQGVTVTVAGNSVINGTVKVSYDNKDVVTDADNVLNITGGTVNGEIVKDNGTISITGGTFGSDVSGYLTTEYAPYANSDGTWTVAKAGAVAKIGKVYYETLAAAAAAAEDDDTITLVADALNEGTIAFNRGRDIVLDLGGHTLKTSFMYAFGDRVTIKHGTVTGDGYFMYVYSAADAELDTGAYSKLVLGNDVTVNGDIVLWGNYGDNTKGYGAQIDVDGIVNGCVFVSGNMTEGNDVVNVRGKVNSGSDIGIALNGYATVNVFDGAEVSSGAENNGTGIEVRSGVLNVTGGKITGYGTYGFTANGNGTSSAGCGIAVAQHTTKKNINVSVTGGVISGTVAMALANPQKNSDGTLTVSVSGGEYHGGVNVVLNDGEERVTRFISGGRFSSAPNPDYLADGYMTKLDGGMYAVCVAPVAQIGSTQYETLEAAVEAAKDGNTITLLKDINLSAQVVVRNKLTLDMAGKKIFNTEDIWRGNNWSLISVQKGGNLTITGNGKLLAKANDCYAADVRDGGILTIKNGEFNGNISAIYALERKVYISGGSFKIQQLADNPSEKYRFTLNCLDANYKNGASDFVVTGGTFYMFDPENNLAEGKDTNFVADGYQAALQNDDEYVVVPKNVAKVGDTVYTNLQEAFNAANDETVTLLDSVTLTSTATIEGKNITLNLAGKNITGLDVRAIWVKSGKLIVNNTATGDESVISSTWAGSLGDSSSVIRVGDSGEAVAELVIGAGVVVSTDHCYGVTVFGTNVNKESVGQILTVNGKVKVTGGASAISGNGSSNYSKTQIVINSGAEVTATQDYAIYHPQAGELTINGGKIEGLGGIEAKAGRSVVSIGGNAEIKATADKTNHSVNNNGTSTSGYALAAVENSGYKGTATIQIENGRITGPVAVVSDNDVTADKAASISITGGTFSVDPSSYVAEGYAAVATPNADSEWKVGKVETSEVAPSEDITESTTEVTFNVKTTVTDETVDETAENATLKETTNDTLIVKGTTESTDSGANTYTEVKTVKGSGTTPAGAVKLNDISNLNEVVQNAIKAAGSKATSVSSIEIAIVKDAGTTTNDAEDETKVTKVTYEVHPEAIAYVDNTAVGSAKIENSQLASNVTYTFKLDVSALNVAVGEKVTVTHVGYEEEYLGVQTLTVQGDGNSRYVVAQATHFSQFETERFTDNEVVLENVVYVDSYSLTMTDKIGVNFFLHLPTEISENISNFELEVHFDGRYEQGITYNLSASSIDNYGTYKYSYYVAPAEGDVPIILKLLDMSNGKYLNIYDNQGETSEDGSFNKSLMDVARIARDSESASENMKALAKNLLTYCAYAKRYFNHNASIANDVVLGDKDTAMAQLATYAAVKPEGTAYDGASLLLATETTIKLYFLLGGESTNYTCTAATYTGAIEANEYVVRISHLAAAELDTMYSVYNGGAHCVTYSALSWANSAINSQSTYAQDMGNAMYWYNSAANTYFNR